MNTREAIAARIMQLCRERRITPNGLSNISAVPQATIKSILNGESQNPGTVTISFSLHQNLTHLSKKFVDNSGQKHHRSWSRSFS